MFNLGQRVYWVETDKAPGKCATVRVFQKNYLTGRYNGDVIAVVDEAGNTQLLDARLCLFWRPDDATMYAFGLAVRLMLNFGYEAATVYDHNGNVIEFPITTIPKRLTNG